MTTTVLATERIFVSKCAVPAETNRAIGGVHGGNGVAAVEGMTGGVSGSICVNARLVVSYVGLCGILLYIVPLFRAWTRLAMSYM